MGNKQGSRRNGASSPGENLNPQERRRLTDFLEEKKGSAKFTSTDIQRLWNDILAPDLLDSYTGFLFGSSHGQRSVIGLNDFISLYVNIIRGSPEEKSKAIATVLGSSKNQQGKQVISYQSLCKYLGDLVESYFFGLNHRNDPCFKSWVQMGEPQRASIEEVVNGMCNDLPHTEDEVRVDSLAKWLQHSALIHLLHCYVLGSMYNLTPEQESTMIPLVHLPTRKSARSNSLLDLSHVVFLNSFLPTENKEVWRLLFSIDIHGESYSKFVACIVNQGPVVVVIRTPNSKFGGFISSNLTLSPKWIGSDSSFIFKIGSSVEVFPATGYNDHYAYFNCHQSTLPNGLGMGGQYGYWGLWIDSHFGEGECSESCTTYKNYKMLDPNKKFQIKSMEVWGVGEPPPSNEEMGLRSSKVKSGRSALDQDPTSTQILEMAGREMHSKHLRRSTMKHD